MTLDKLRLAKSTALVVVLCGLIWLLLRRLYVIVLSAAAQLFWGASGRSRIAGGWPQIALEATALAIQAILGYWGISWLHSVLLLNNDADADFKKYL